MRAPSLGGEPGYPERGWAQFAVERRPADGGQSERRRFMTLVVAASAARKWGFMTSSAVRAPWRLRGNWNSDSDEVRNSQRRHSGRTPSPPPSALPEPPPRSAPHGEPICVERLRPLPDRRAQAQFPHAGAQAPGAQAGFVMPLPCPVPTRLVMPGIGAANHARAIGDGERSRHGGGPEDTLKDDGIDGEHRQYSSPSHPGRTSFFLGRGQIGRMSRKDTSSEAPSIWGGRGLSSARLEPYATNGVLNLHARISATKRGYMRTLFMTAVLTAALGLAAPASASRARRRRGRSHRRRGGRDHRRPGRTGRRCRSRCSSATP